MPAFCKAEYLAMLARAHVHNCMFPGNQGLGFEEGTTSSQVVSAHFFWSALCHPAAPALLHAFDSHSDQLLGALQRRVIQPGSQC